MSERLTKTQIDWLVNLGLEEDLGAGDITTDSIVEQNQVAQAIVTAKEPLVLCGLDIFRAVFLKLDPETTFSGDLKDGDKIEKGETILELRGHSRALLKGERTALNILQQLSGIATLTRTFVQRAQPVTVLDTRKTTPGLRVFEKYAVRCGGGSNHRLGLYDAVLIKDNHIKAAGSILNAVQRVRDRGQGDKTIEVETTNLEEVREALESGAQMIMLDNMPLDMIRQAVKEIKGRAKIEVSGTITLKKLNDLSQTGIDFVSVGALTHSARAVDISMNINIA